MGQEKLELGKFLAVYCFCDICQPRKRRSTSPQRTGNDDQATGEFLFCRIEAGLDEIIAELVERKIDRSRG